MKVLIRQGLGANLYIRLAWANALHRLGHQVVFWNSQEKSPLDIFYEFRPDFFIGDTWQLERATIKAIAKYPETKVLLYASDWGDFNKENKFPVQFATDEEKKNVETLKKLTGKPDYVFCQYHDSYVGKTHNLWREVGCEPFGLLLSADIVDYELTAPSKDHVNDIVFMGGYWPYKSKTIAPYLFPLIYPNTNAKVKIFGFGGWPVPNFLGSASSKTMCKFYSSAKVSPNLFEEHSLAYGYDVNQRTYQISAAGGFQICQNVESVRKHIFSDNEIVFADNPEDFIAKTIFYIRNPDQRFNFIKKAVNTIYSGHTNFHRIGKILSVMGFTESMDAYAYADNVYSEVYNKINQPEFENSYLEL